MYLGGKVNCMSAGVLLLVVEVVVVVVVSVVFGFSIAFGLFFKLNLPNLEFGCVVISGCGENSPGPVRGFFVPLSSECQVNFGNRKRQKSYHL